MQMCHASSGCRALLQSISTPAHDGLDRVMLLLWAQHAEGCLWLRRVICCNFRVYGGLHLRKSNLDPVTLGDSVAGYAFRNFDKNWGRASRFL
jgi:hypothetical protein